MSKENNCIFCDKEHTDEYLSSMEFRNSHNRWDDILVIFEVLKMVKSRSWSWVWSDDCKYLDVRIDMRDGYGIIKNRSGKRISPNQLRWQYSPENENPIPDSEAYA